MIPRRIARIGEILLLALCVAAAVHILTGGRGADPGPTPYRDEELTASRFLPVVSATGQPPRVRELALPDFDDATSVWGALGRDFQGHIWVGVSARSPGRSAHLLEYDPDADRWQDHGSVVEQLRAARRHHDGEGQIKIHSRIVPARDGWMYFASSDEEGESPIGEVPPRWGGHLWRIHPRYERWQHLLAVPEGLVAVAGAGRYVYALGYWGHVLHQYDTATGNARRIAVGSIGAHVSRNLLADPRGHAFVPRLTVSTAGAVSASLIEYDENLRELGATPLAHYLGKAPPRVNHGIIAITHLPDGRMVFATHIGQLYVIEPRPHGPATVTAAGWLHPDGEAYAPSLFSGGSDSIAGVTHRKDRYEWVVSDLGRRSGAAYPLDTLGLDQVLLYGSMARDDAGRAYVGGWAAALAGGQRPLLLQITPGP